MQNITVDSRTFCFDDSWLIMKYDETPFYKNHFKNEKGWKKSMKGVDLIAFDPTYKNLFLIESKDYRKHRRKKKISPEEEFFGKDGRRTSGFRRLGRDCVETKKPLGVRG